LYYIPEVKLINAGVATNITIPTNIIINGINIFVAASSPNYLAAFFLISQHSVA
jgi:hypothetical protein